MKHIAFVSALAIAAATAAHAGGPVVPAPEPVIAPVAVVAPMTTWQGAYLGGSLVRGDGSIDGTDDLEAAGTLGDLEGFGGALRLGYDAQFNKAVLGAGASYDFGTYDDSRNGLDSEISDIATVFLRAGYDMGQWMPYILAGYSWGSTELSLGDLSAEQDIDGYTVGLGGEYRFGAKWAGFAEITYTDFDELDCDDSAPGSACGLEADLTRVNLGVNYRF